MKGKLAAGVVAGILALTAGALVKPWEGRSLTPYLDIVGRWTWCYGETQGQMKPRYTQAECDALLNESLGKYLTELQACIHKPLRQHEWAALLSLAYNSGTEAVCRSTMVRMINAGERPGVWCAQLHRWVYAGGKRVRGLVNRRQAEYRMCLGYDA